MIRLATLAAMAVFVAAPASAQSLTISTAGKSPEQVREEISLVARKLCIREFFGASYPADTLRGCVDTVVNDTLTNASNPALVALASSTQVAER